MDDTSSLSGDTMTSDPCDPNELAGLSAAPQAWRTRIPEQLYPTSFVAQETIDYLERHAKCGSEDPFFIQCAVLYLIQSCCRWCRQRHLCRRSGLRG